MPFLAPLTMAGATLIEGASAGAATIYGATKQSGAAKRASQIEDKTAADTIAFEREKEATRKAEFDRQQAEAEKQWQAQQAQARQQFDLDLNDRTFNRNVTATREANLAPYRSAGHAALQSLGSMLGLKFDPNVPAVNASPYDPGPSADDERALTLLGQMRNGLTPTSESLGTLIDGLNKAGIKATRATHANGTLPSDDKIVLPSGYITDQIFDVGAPDARWT